MSDINENENDFKFADDTKKYSDENTDLSSIENLFLELTGKNTDKELSQNNPPPVTCQENGFEDREQIDSIINYFESTMPKDFNPDSSNGIRDNEAEVPPSAERTVKGVPDKKIRRENRRVIYSEDDENTRDMFREEPQDIHDIKTPFMISANDIINDEGITFTDSELREKGFTEEDINIYRAERNKALGHKKKEKGFTAFKNDFIPQKTDKPAEKVRKIILLVSVLTLCSCAVFFGVNYYQKVNAQKTPVITEPTVNQTDTEEQKWAKIKAEHPDVVFPDGMNIKYAGLYAQNQDTVGWLEIPGTKISTPVVQFKGDKDRAEEFYLKHDFYKKSNKYGNPFVEWADDTVNLSANTVIHGHNMYDGLMFADLEKYLKLDGYKESPVITFNTLFGNYKWKIFAVIVSNGSSTGDNGYLFNFTVTCFESKEKQKTFIEALNERSLIDTGVDVNENDKLLTLNTCCYGVNGVTLDDARLAVVARLVREGESDSIDTSKAVMRENVRFPQMYYDRKGESNPYADAFRWRAGD